MRPGNLFPLKRTRVLGLRVGPRRVDWGRIAPVVVGTTAVVLGIDRLRRSSGVEQEASDLLLEFYEHDDEREQPGWHDEVIDDEQDEQDEEDEERRGAGQHGELARTMTEPGPIASVVTEPAAAEPSRSSPAVTGDGDTSADRLTADGLIGISLLRWEFASIRLRLVLRGLTSPGAGATSRRSDEPPA